MISCVEEDGLELELETVDLTELEEIDGEEVDEEVI